MVRAVMSVRVLSTMFNAYVYVFMLTCTHIAAAAANDATRPYPAAFTDRFGVDYSANDEARTDHTSAAMFLDELQKTDLAVESFSAVSAKKKHHSAHCCLNQI